MDNYDDLMRDLAERKVKLDKEHGQLIDTLLGPCDREITMSRLNQVKTQLRTLGMLLDPTYRRHIAKRAAKLAQEVDNG